MEKFYQEQVERIDRLMKIVEAGDPYKDCRSMTLSCSHANPCGI